MDVEHKFCLYYVGCISYVGKTSTDQDDKIVSYLDINIVPMDVRVNMDDDAVNLYDDDDGTLHKS